MDGCTAAQVRQSESRPSISAIKRTHKRVECAVLVYREKLSIRLRVSAWAEIRRHDADRGNIRFVLTGVGRIGSCTDSEDQSQCWCRAVLSQDFHQCFPQLSSRFLESVPLSYYPGYGISFCGWCSGCPEQGDRWCVDHPVGGQNPAEAHERHPHNRAGDGQQQVELVIQFVKARGQEIACPRGAGSRQ